MFSLNSIKSLNKLQNQWLSDVIWKCDVNLNEKFVIYSKPRSLNCLIDSAWKSWPEVTPDHSNTCFKNTLLSIHNESMFCWPPRNENEAVPVLQKSFVFVYLCFYLFVAFCCLFVILSQNQKRKINYFKNDVFGSKVLSKRCFLLPRKPF